MKNNEKWTLDSYSVSEFYSIIKSEHYKSNQEERRSSGNPISYIHIWPYLKFKFSIIQFYLQKFQKIENQHDSFFVISNENYPPIHSVPTKNLKKNKDGEIKDPTDDRDFKNPIDDR